MEHKNKTVSDDPCDVCGDVACAYNNQGLTCHSCRMFFRRHAAKREKLRCQKEGRCQIDFSTRKCCRKCRLEKCFAIGMKMKRQIQPRPRKVYQPRIPPQLTDLLDRHIKLEVLQNIDTCTVKSADIEIDSNDSDSIKYSTSVQTSDKASDLTAYERQQIAEVQTAMSAFVEETNLEEKGSINGVKGVITLLNCYARQIIRFCKSISAFKKLSQENQLIILKPFYFEIMIYRTAYSYDEKRHGFLCIQNEQADNAIFFYMPKTNDSSSHNTFAKTLHDQMENDVTIRNLLSAQSLFKPRDNITCPEYLKYHHMYYTNLLKRYLENKYKNSERANKKFLELMHINQDFCQVREKIVQFLKTVDINQASGICTCIMYEVFDMKNW